MMSFTGKVKDEVSKLEENDMESISELSAIVQSVAIITDSIVISTENNSVARKIYNLFKRLFDVYPKITVRRGYNYNKKMIYILEIKKNILSILKKIGFESVIPSDFIIADDELIRVYLRGLFMMCGSINDPKTSRYHLEFNLSNLEYASFVCALLNDYDLNSKLLHRDNRYMVYVKEAEKIGDFLRMIGAYNAVMYYEDIRIYRDHKNMTNRLNNCEQANVDRIIETSNNQVKDIEVIENEGIMDLLDEKEKVAASYRVKYKDASLAELAEIISLETGNKITKSGLYHRFKKIKNMADKIRKKSL
ncbi:MAG: DNA-binding protein WhiA [Bacilli bacterium]|nr:DNA-binding protein WhiA [Bacilli bacterium]